MSKSISDSIDIDDALKGLKLNHDQDPNGPAWLRDRGITVWLPQEYKQKYALIQEKSGRKFSKVLKEVIMKCIDRVEVG